VVEAIDSTLVVRCFVFRGELSVQKEFFPLVFTVFEDTSDKSLNFL
jgi:hypothetical protein